jgi:hypothetical protein
MKSWRDVLKIHPAADLFPMMSPDELVALGEDIKKHGMRVPLVLWHGHDDLELQLLDGRNRLDALEAVGVNLVLETPINPGLAVDVTCFGREVLIQHEKNGVDPYAYVISANIHRRHLTGEQKRELIAKLIKTAPEKSNRQIADQVKVDHKTVAPIRADLERRGEIPHIEYRTDTKGREQPVHKVDKQQPIDVAYSAIRQRVADGGPGWTPGISTPIPIDADIPEFLRRKRPEAKAS